MKVSELADRTGTSAKTIRFYEAEGILPPPARRENSYRDYSEEDLCRVRLVVALRGLGLDLAEGGRLAELCSTGRCDEMASDLVLLIADRRRVVAAAMAELVHLDGELAALENTLALGEPQEPLCIGKA